MTIVKLLLETGQTDVDGPDRYGQTPLSRVAERGYKAVRGHEAVVKLLLKTNQIEINRPYIFGRTPLWWASVKGHETVIQALDINLYYCSLI